jgi:hypothetical protein
MSGQPPEPDHVENGDAAYAGQNGQSGEPDPLLAFLVGEESRAAAQNIEGRLAIKRTWASISKLP